MGHFIAACSGGDLAEVECQLKAGADPNEDAGGGWTALIKAIFGGHEEVARVLMEAGADLETGPQGYTALLLAVEKGFGDLAQTLLRANANPRARRRAV